MSISEIDNFYPTRARLVPGVPKEFQRNTFRQLPPIPKVNRSNAGKSQQQSSVPPPLPPKPNPTASSHISLVSHPPPKRPATTSPKPIPSPLLHNPLIDSVNLPPLSRNSSSRDTRFLPSLPTLSNLFDELSSIPSLNPKSPAKFIGLTPGYQNTNGDSWNLGLTPSIFGGLGSANGGVNGSSSKGAGGTGITPFLNGFAKEINPFEYHFGGVEPGLNDVNGLVGEKRPLATPGESIDPKRFKASPPTPLANSLAPKPKRTDTDSGSSAASEGRSFFSSGNVSSGLETSTSEGPSKYTSPLQRNGMNNGQIKEEDENNTSGAQAIISGLAINPQQLIHGTVSQEAVGQSMKTQQLQQHQSQSRALQNGVTQFQNLTTVIPSKNGIPSYSQSTLYIPPFQSSGRNTRSSTSSGKNQSSEIVLSDEEEDDDDDEIFMQRSPKGRGKRKESITSSAARAKGGAMNGFAVNGKAKGKEPKGKAKIEDTEEEKRKQFLERNRIAACKSRQKKKEWIQNLGVRAEELQVKNNELSQIVTDLREEIIQLRTQLAAHAGCSCDGAKAFLRKEQERNMRMTSSYPPPGSQNPHLIHTLSHNHSHVHTLPPGAPNGIHTRAQIPNRPMSIITNGLMEASPSSEPSPVMTLSPALTDIPIYGTNMGLPSADPRNFTTSRRGTMMSIEMPPPFENENANGYPAPPRPSSAPPTTPSELKAIGLDRESYFSIAPKLTPSRMMGGYFDTAGLIDDSMVGISGGM